MALDYAAADRLRVRFGLLPGETGILAVVLAADGVATRDVVQAASRVRGHSYPTTGNSFSVLLCRLNAKLPATVRIVPHYPTERGRYVKGQKGSGKAVGYALSSAWARDQLMRIACPEPEAVRAP